MDAAIIEKEALQLPEYDRALLADRLIESISPIPDDQRKAWIRESDDRLQAFHEGLIPAVDGPKALEDLRKKFSR